MSKMDTIKTVQKDEQCTRAAEKGTWSESINNGIAEKTRKISKASANDQYVKLSEIHINGCIK